MGTTEIIFIVSTLVLFLVWIGIPIYKSIKKHTISEPVKTILDKLKDTPMSFIITRVLEKEGTVSTGIFKYITVYDEETEFTFTITVISEGKRHCELTTNLTWATDKENEALALNFYLELQERENKVKTTNERTKRLEVAKLYNVEIKR